MAKKITYTEPSNYFPEDILKKNKLGKYKETGKKKTTTKSKKK